MSQPVQVSAIISERDSIQAMRYDYLFEERFRADEIDATIARISKDVLRDSGLTQDNARLSFEISFDMPTDVVNQMSGEIRREPTMQKGKPL